jgi:hypothetical protein
MRLVNSTLSLAAVLTIVLAACGSQAGQREIGAAMIVPVRPAPVQSGEVAQSAKSPGSTPTSSPPAGSIYRSGWHGYDASFPQCKRGHRPLAADFSVIGVNGGRVFTTDRCIGLLWRAGITPRALYLNSGYDPRYYGRATSDCRDLSHRLEAAATLRGAYALGCSAVVYSLRALKAARIGTPSMWWIDVELANAWDSENLNLNRFALQGQIDQLIFTGKPVGVYSAARDWMAITGNWAAGVDANWVAGTTTVACAAPGFSGDPVWLVQEATGWLQSSGYDSDRGC